MKDRHSFMIFLGCLLSGILTFQGLPAFCVHITIHDDLFMQQVLGNSRNQTHTNLRGSATCLHHGATDLY